MAVISQFLLCLFIQNHMNKDKITMRVNNDNEMMRAMKEPGRLQHKIHIKY